jgi:hypothetical protein
VGAGFSRLFRNGSREPESRAESDETLIHDLEHLIEAGGTSCRHVVLAAGNRRTVARLKMSRSNATSVPRIAHGNRMLLDAWQLSELL